MMRTPFDPIEYFAQNPLRESLLIRFRVDESQKQVEIAYDYAAQAVSDHFERADRGEPSARPPARDFRRLVLTDVKSVAVIDAERVPSKKGYWDSLNDEIARSPIVVQYGSLRVLKSGYLLTLVISRAREYRIDFGSMLVERRLGKAIPTKQPGTWKYVDTETGEEFPFDRPFR